MKYHDTGGQEPHHALAAWMANAVTPGLAKLRIQSGYFSRRALGAIREPLEAAATRDCLTRVLIGSNDGETLHSDVRRLATLVGIPRPAAQLGVVKFQNALFHPKVYHVERADGSQAAFVGSANFTRSGVNGINVEAAVSLDTLEGDPLAVLNEIAAAIDAWFDHPLREGLHLISSATDVDLLLQQGILASVRPPRQGGRAGGDRGLGGPRRHVLISIPVLPDDVDPDTPPEPDELEEAVTPAGPAGGAVVPAAGSGLPSPIANGALAGAGAPSAGVPAGGAPTVPQSAAIPGSGAETVADVTQTELPVERLTLFPDYFLFAPGATTETEGFEGLSGLPLPDDAAGLLIALKKANARKFLGKGGTADINIPISVLGTLRFGRAGKHSRPSTRVQLRFRFLASAAEPEGEILQIVTPNEIPTRIAGYGYTPDETGHADVRMTMPNAVHDLAGLIETEGYELPTTGDYMVLEWPNENADCFGLTFLAQGSALATQAATEFSVAKAENRVTGGAVLIPPGFVPAWPAEA